ncbi:MAG: hypothetical protein JW771_02935 [Candidatus Thermoplasmatota archaeon]|nr:hypothetical protein [Candidatus Thermoplasmatota archaeon]
MIKQILILLSQGNHTIAEIAQRANLSKEDLLNRFEMMEWMGYLQKSNITASKGRTHEPGKMCAFCPVARECLNHDITVPTYHLTEKGKRIIS